jgi:hypothetical protein
MTDEDTGRDAIAERLVAERAIPRAGFRAELRRRLIEASATRSPPPRRLRTLIAAQALSGATLIAVVAVGVAGVGPFAA